MFIICLFFRKIQSSIFPKSVVAIHEDREISNDTKIFQESCERWPRYACILLKLKCSLKKLLFTTLNTDRVQRLLFLLLEKFKNTNFSTYTPQKQAQ